MVALRGAGTIRGQRYSKLLLGIAEIPHYGAQGESEHPGMPLLAGGGKGDIPGSRVDRRPTGLPEPDDFPDFQRLRHVAVQEARTRHPQPWRVTMETPQAPAPVAYDWRSHPPRR